MVVELVLYSEGSNRGVELLRKERCGRSEGWRSACSGVNAVSLRQGRTVRQTTALKEKVSHQSMVAILG